MYVQNIWYYLNMNSCNLVFISWTVLRLTSVGRTEMYWLKPYEHLHCFCGIHVDAVNCWKLKQDNRMIQSMIQWWHILSSVSVWYSDEKIYKVIVGPISVWHLSPCAPKFVYSSHLPASCGTKMCQLQYSWLAPCSVLWVPFSSIKTRISAWFILLQR